MLLEIIIGVTGMIHKVAPHELVVSFDPLVLNFCRPKMEPPASASCSHAMPTSWRCPPLQRGLIHHHNSNCMKKNSSKNKNIYCKFAKHCNIASRGSSDIPLNTFCVRLQQASSSTRCRWDAVELRGYRHRGQRRRRGWRRKSRRAARRPDLARRWCSPDGGGAGEMVFEGAWKRWEGLRASLSRLLGCNGGTEQRRRSVGWIACTRGGFRIVVRSTRLGGSLQHARLGATYLPRADS
jgi:hypothetical protein